MKRLSLLLGLLLVLSLTTVAADLDRSLPDLLNIDSTDLSDKELIDTQKSLLLDNLDLLATECNAYAIDLPRPINNLFNGDIVTVHLEDTTFSFKIENGLITDIGQGTSEDASIQIHVDDNVLQSLNYSTFDLQSAINEEDITYFGNTFKAKAKCRILSAGLTLISWVR
jgi:hypothetical protein